MPMPNVKQHRNAAVIPPSQLFYRDRSLRDLLCNFRDEMAEPCLIILCEIYKLNAREAVGNLAVLKQEWNDSFIFVNSEGEFIENIFGCHRMRGENYKEKAAGFERILDDTIPPLTCPDVALIQPDIQTLSGEIVYQAIDKFGIGP
jgi:hypothetical protein